MVKLKCTDEELAGYKGAVADGLAKVEAYRRGVAQETAALQGAIETLVSKSGYHGPYGFGDLGAFVFSKVPGRGSAEKGYAITPYIAPIPK